MLQHVFTGRDEMQANFVRGLLLEQGIVGVVQGALLQEVWGGVPISKEGLPSVWVEEIDVPRARPIIEEYNRREEAEAELLTANKDKDDPFPPRPTWTCAHCGEKVEEQFTQCWHCGHQRPQSDAGPSAS